MMATLPFRQDMIISSGARYSGGHRIPHHNRRKNIEEVSLGRCAVLLRAFILPCNLMPARNMNARWVMARLPHGIAPENMGE
jgi:hypothetical protein